MENPHLNQSKGYLVQLARQPMTDSPVSSNPASFRDPSGFIFTHEGTIYRWVAESYKAEFEALKASGLLKDLQEMGALVQHTEVTLPLQGGVPPYAVLKPEPIPFISYPQEWSFNQLKDAALLTLAVTIKALEKGFILKDASAYNVQFVDAKPVFIDTLSFERYEEGTPWVAYKQFCQHFLAPLALMSYTDVSLGKLMGTYIDGIPLDIASKILPWQSKLSLGLLLHIHFHAKSQRKYSDKELSDKKTQAPKMSKNSLLGLLDGLKGAVSGLHWKAEGTEWADYYSATNYSNQAMSEKAKLVGEYLRSVAPKTVWDLGANTGVFSHIAADGGAETVSFDIDPAAVDRHYQFLKSTSKASLLPLVLDLTNPTSGYGWAGTERSSVAGRGPADTVMALALIHHLALSNNVPLAKIAEYFATLSRTLIIEFVPKSDSQVQKLLKTRKDIFPRYNEADFEADFAPFFTMKRKEKISGSERTLYLMEKR